MQARGVEAAAAGVNDFKEIDVEMGGVRARGVEEWWVMCRWVVSNCRAEASEG